MSRRARLIAAGLTGAAGFALVAAGCAFSAPRWRGAPGPHFDGKRFRSIEPIHQSFADFLRWIANRDRGSWRPFTNTPPGPRPPERVNAGKTRVTFINHATVLIQMDGLNILTDPVWSERVSPVSFAGPRRHRPPGILFSDLPAIDAVLISHNHYDHLDLPTLRRLADAHHPRVFAGLGNAAFLEKHGVARARDLDWWDAFPLAPGVTLTAVPARHFSGRSPFDSNGTLWCGWVVTGPSGSFYFAGDTGWGSHFQMIHDRFPNLRLAFLPIGAYRPRGFMAPVHIDPEEAVRALEILRAETAVAIHFGTFAQADDGEFEPVAALKAALVQRREPRPRFVVLDNGQSLDLP